MSDKASIIIQYNISSKIIPDRKYKGVICNHYRGYDPKGLVMRAALGLAYFMNNHHDLRRICGPIENDLTYHTFRRVFDVDFVNHELWVSVDGVEESKRKLNAGKIDKAQFSDSLMWQDVDFGQLLIDIKGVEGSATAKYAFVKNIYDTENCYSVEEYLELHKTGQDDQLMAAVKGFKEYATIMTLEEVKEFVGADLYEYAFYNEMQNEKSHNKKDRITDEDPIEELELSIRAYNCLKRAGVATVGQLRLMSEEELLSCRNMGRKNVEEIRNILNDTIRSEWNQDAAGLKIEKLERAKKFRLHLVARKVAIEKRRDYD